MTPLTPERAVERCQAVFAHAWMVRTFVKHSPEVEEFPELMQVVRTVFDVSRAVESRTAEPVAYFHQLRKKMRRLKEAAAQFRQDAPVASDHTNFRLAVLSLEACVQEWEQLLADVEPLLKPLREQALAEASAARARASAGDSPPVAHSSESINSAIPEKSATETSQSGVESPNVKVDQPTSLNLAVAASPDADGELQSVSVRNADRMQAAAAELLDQLESLSDEVNRPAIDSSEPLAG